MVLDVKSSAALSYCQGRLDWLRHAVVKFGKIIGGLLLLNLGLVGYLVLIIVRPPNGQDASPEIATPPPAVTTVYVTNFVALPWTNAFHWGELESQDYRAYIQNLRQVGCPEQTIRDIIIADLDMLWAPRIRSLLPPAQAMNYWESAQEKLANDFDGRARERQERAIDREKRDVVRELVEVDLASERHKLQGKEDPHERRLQFLPAQKRMDAREIMDLHQEEESQIRERVAEEGAPLTAEERNRLKEIKDARTAALDQLLTPAERELYELWTSPSADTVRHDFYGMEATEEEFRKVYALQRAFDEDWNRDQYNVQDPTVGAMWGKAKSELDSKVKQALGEERFTQYQRGRDEDFHLLNAAVSRYGLRREQAAAVYQMKQVLAQEKEWVQQNAEFTQAQKQTALAAMERETQLAVKEALGENAYNYYQRRAAWLKAGRHSK